MATCDSNFPSVIDSLLLGELAPAKWPLLRAHIKDCTSCRERYNRVSLAERMLHGGPGAIDSPSPAMFDRVGASLFDPPKAERSALLRLPRWVFGMVSFGAAAAVLTFMVRPRHNPSSESEFAARGAPTDVAQQVGLRVFCLDGNDVRSLDPGATPPRCSTSDLLKFTYSNQSGYEDLFLVGFDSDWSIKWYEPRPPSGLSVPAVRAVDQSVGAAVKIGVNHEPGPLRIFILFAHAPIDAREIEAAAATLKQRHVSPHEALELPLDGRSDVVQRSLLLEITPGSP